MIATHLRVNHLDNPLGYLLENPAFSWAVENPEHAEVRSSRLVVSAGGETVADTGWADLDNIACRPGLTLSPCTRYTWTVSLRTDDGRETTSDTAWFETGKMREPWTARWLSCNGDEPRHPIFIKDIPLSGQVVDARLYVMGLGVYDVYIGGRHVADEYLAPGTHAYDQRLQVNTYDVTEELSHSAHLEVHMGNGWWKGRFGFIPKDEGYYGQDWRLLAEVRVVYADGGEEVFGTGPDWGVKRSTTYASNIYDGESRDDTLPDLPVERAELLGDTESADAMERLSDRLSLPIRAHEIFHPELLDTPAGETVYDMGQNFAGTFRLHIDEPAGTEVTIQLGELLQDGNFYRGNLRSARAEYRYVSDGEPHVIEPRFTYYGYRYIKVEGARNLSAADCTGVALYSDFEMTGSIQTGNALVNRLIANVEWSMKSNFVDTPTDCPQRDERMGWTGDAQVFAPTALYLADQLPFYRKYLHDMALEQAVRDGATPMASPCFMLGTSPAIWGDATCTIPWNTYLFSGDPGILDEHFEAMSGWVDYVRGVDGDDHGWGRAFQFGDWLALDGPKGARTGATDEGFIAYLYYWRSARITAEAARLTGREREHEKYESLAEDIASWIRREYYTETGRCAVNTQTAYVLSIVSGFGSSAFSGKALSRALELNDGKLATGFIGTEFLLRALCEAGEAQAAYDLLLNEDYPGWLHEVKLGATTIWEHWNSLDDDGRVNTEDTMNSMNHYSYGAVLAWLFGLSAGLRPVEEEPGFRRAIVEPRPSWRLGSLACTHGCAAGTWRVAWRCEDEDHVVIDLTVPHGCVAELRLPLADETVYEKLGGRELGAGDYRIAYRTTEPIRRVPSVDWPLARLLGSQDTAPVLNRHCYHPDWVDADEAARKSVRELAGRLGKHGSALSPQALEALNRELLALAEPDPATTVA